MVAQHSSLVCVCHDDVFGDGQLARHMKQGSSQSFHPLSLFLPTDGSGVVDGTRQGERNWPALPVDASKPS